MSKKNELIFEDIWGHELGYKDIFKLESNRKIRVYTIVKNRVEKIGIFSKKDIIDKFW